MPMPKMNLIGQQFSRLTVLDFAGADSKQQTLFRCACECGNEVVVAGKNLKAKQVQSCGCLRVDKGREAGLQSKVHGLIRTPTYRSWQSMKSRCLYSHERSYRWYGQKGVTICDKWMSFDGFLEDMGERPEGMTLDRINPFGNYEKNNCRWADNATQKSNTRKRYAEALCL
jgi:hypothetical protein